MATHDDIEQRAYFALQGAALTGAGWRGDVAKALRSNEPLSAEFRNALATAIDGHLHGFRLELIADKGLKKERQDFFTGVQVRRRNVEIGDWILGQIVQGATTQVAVRAAAERAGTGWPSNDGCEKALIYTRRIRAWMKSVTPDHPLACLGDGLEDFFHVRDASGQPLDEVRNSLDM